MKRIVLFLFILLCTASTCIGESILSFSSFDGGGYEYTAIIENPDLLSINCFREYGSSRKSYETGSAYQMVFRFSGIKPGETRIFITAESPILENYEMTFVVTISEALAVSLSAEQSLAGIRLYHNGRRIPSVYYEMTKKAQDYYLSVDYENSFLMDPEAAKTLYDIFTTYNLASWNGFSGIGPNALESEQFDLEIRLSDGTLLRAFGDNSFPPNYREAMDAMTAALENAAAAE